VRDYQKYAIVVSVFAAVLYLSLIVAGFGVVSLITDREVIDEPLAGPVLGPVMAGVPVVLVFALMVKLGITTRPEHQRVALGYAIGSGFAASATFVVVGAVGFALEGGAAAPFAGTLLTSPFTVITGLFGAIVVLSYSLILATQQGQRGRPLWPWERRGDT
jgi:FtsH-binding integral membrane protein